MVSCRAPIYKFKQSHNTFDFRLTGLSKSKIPLLLCYLVFDRRMITTRPATPGGSKSKVALDHSSNNHEVASPSRNSEINYPNFLYVCVCLCAFVCLLDLAAVSGVDLGRVMCVFACLRNVVHAALSFSLKRII